MTRIRIVRSTHGYAGGIPVLVKPGIYSVLRRSQKSIAGLSFWCVQIYYARCIVYIPERDTVALSALEELALVGEKL